MIQLEDIDEQTMQKILDARGYIVLAGYRPYVVGEILPFFGVAFRDIDQKARVIALTDIADFIEQARVGDYDPGDTLGRFFNYCRIIVE